MNKTDARKFYRSIRNDFTFDEVIEKSNLIFEHIKNLDILHLDVFHIFLPIRKNNEINTYPIIDWLFQNKKDVILPLVVGNDMINCKVNSNFETQLNQLQIPEPINYTEIDSLTIDVIFIPLFIADKYGNRVGYGGGYYDRFLSKCKPNAKKIGLSYFKPIEIIDDIHEGDIALDYLVTPEGIVSF